MNSRRVERTQRVLLTMSIYRVFWSNSNFPRTLQAPSLLHRSTKQLSLGGGSQKWSFVDRFLLRQHTGALPSPLLHLLHPAYNLVVSTATLMWKLLSKEPQDGLSIGLEILWNPLPDMEHWSRILRRETMSILFVMCVTKHNWSRVLWEFSATMVWRSRVLLARKRGHPESKRDCFLKSEASCLTCVAPLRRSNIKGI